MLLLTFVLEQHFELILSDCKAQVICGIDDENDSFALGVVVLPEGTVTPLPRHVEHSEVDLVPLKCFHLETDCGCELLLLILLRLQVVYHRRLARVV